MQKNKVKNRIKFFKKCLEDFNCKKFDLIVSNPPYIKSRKLKI